MCLMQIVIFRFIFAKNSRMIVLNYNNCSRCLTLLALLLWATKTTAQVKCVIVDKETGTPIRDVKLYADGKLIATTNYMGQLEADSTFSSASLSQPDYLTRVVAIEELRDTLWLLPKAIRLDEVVVWGKYKPGIQGIVSSATEGLKAYAPPGGLVTFDFFEMFRKKPLNKKARKRNAEILREWDNLPDNTDKSEEKADKNALSTEK